MPRARNIKPSFFVNEELADCDPLARLLFIGLWCVADRDGKLEYRPKRLKISILPYDDCKIEKLLEQLARVRLVRLYKVESSEYIYIPNFTAHQNPHKNEKESQLPDFSSDREITGAVQEKHQSDPADSLLLIPDSCSLIPDPGLLKPDSGNIDADASHSGKPERINGKQVAAVFEFWKETMGHKRAALDAKRDKAIRARLKDGYSVDDLKRAVEGCKASSWHQGQNDRGKVFDDIELICRTAKHVDQFLREAEMPEGMQKLSGAGKATAIAGLNWMEEMQNGA